MTEYTLRVSIAICGDVITLCHVAEAIARHVAAGHGTLPLHGTTLNNLLPFHTKSLLSEARAGRLLVCNQAGYQGTVDEIIDAAKNSGDLSESRRYLVEPDWEKLRRENPPVVAGSDVWNFSGIDLGATETDWDMTYGLCICTKLHCLNEWGKTRGDVFHIVDAGVDVVEYGPKNEHGEFAYRGLVGGMSHAPAAKSEDVPVTSPSGDDVEDDDDGDWIIKCPAIAQKLGEKQLKTTGARQVTARNIHEAVAEELALDPTTHGRQGPRSAHSVRTVGLKEWKFCPPKRVKKVD